MWAIWAAILQGIFILQFFAAGGIPSGPDKGSPPFAFLAMTFSGFILSCLIRWFVLPRQKTNQALMTTMIIGLALSEGTGILGMFFLSSDYPSAKLAAFICATIGIVLFAPIYALKETEPES